MAKEVVILSKEEYQALINSQPDEEELEYLKACQYTLDSYTHIKDICPKCREAVLIDGYVCPCCGYDPGSKDLHKYSD